MQDVYLNRDFSPLPGYDSTQITLLARDPHWLYAYWEISDERKNTFIRDFGYEAWQNSIPLLKIKNLTQDRSFFVRINDFSTSWYIHVEDSNCAFSAELGRKLQGDFYVNLAYSNSVMTPGNCISPNTEAFFADYRDVRNKIVPRKAVVPVREYISGNETKAFSGISSPELLGIKAGEAVQGVSSAEMLNLPGHQSRYGSRK